MRRKLRILNGLVEKYYDERSIRQGLMQAEDRSGKQKKNIV